MGLASLRPTGTSPAGTATGGRTSPLPSPLPEPASVPLLHCMPTRQPCHRDRPSEPAGCQRNILEQASGATAGVAHQGCPWSVSFHTPLGNGASHLQSRFQKGRVAGSLGTQGLDSFAGCRCQTAVTWLQARRDICCLSDLGPGGHSRWDPEAPGTAPRLQRGDEMVMNHPSLCSSAVRLPIASRAELRSTPQICRPAV